LVYHCVDTLMVHSYKENTYIYTNTATDTWTLGKVTKSFE